jgi:hypothetical protein
VFRFGLDVAREGFGHSAAGEDARQALVDSERRRAEAGDADAAGGARGEDRGWGLRNGPADAGPPDAFVDPSGQRRRRLENASMRLRR